MSDVWGVDDLRAGVVHERSTDLGALDLEVWGADGMFVVDDGTHFGCLSE